MVEQAMLVIAVGFALVPLCAFMMRLGRWIGEKTNRLFDQQITSEPEHRPSGNSPTSNFSSQQGA